VDVCFSSSLYSKDNSVINRFDQKFLQSDKIYCGSSVIREDTQQFFGSTMMGKPIRLLIADKDMEFARKLREALHNQADIKVIEIVRDGQGAVNVCKMTLPDLVLMDLRLPVLDSVRAIQAITADNERVKVLAISSIVNDRYAVEAVKAGAWGYIEKNGEADVELIINAIRQVAQGDAWLNPALASSILAEFHRLSD
jgi:DNA-binding NarL/FixJ family response regulator